MPTATATDKNPTHHVTLSDGSTTYGFVLVDGRGDDNPRAITRTPIQRTSLKTSSGSTEYSDFEEPFIPIAQDDWSGGRGNDDFDKDSTRFYDSYRANTWMNGRIMMGPQEVYTSGVQLEDEYMPYTDDTGVSIDFDLDGVNYLQPSAENGYFSHKFTCGANQTAKYISVILRYDGAPAALTCGIWSDSAGKPNAALQEATVTTSAFGLGAQVSTLYRFTITTQALTATTVYHVVLTANAADNTTNYWTVGTNNAASSESAYRSPDGSTWDGVTPALYFRITPAEDNRESKFFYYRSQLYFVTKPDDGSAAQLWMNGDRGTADANTGALTTLVDATKSWTTDEFAGDVVRIVAGTGAEETITWRTISSNTGTVLTVSPAWGITHDTTTSYVILGDDSWRELTGHGLTKPVTDVAVMRDAVYFAQGDYLSTSSPTAVRRATLGTTPVYSDDGTNYARWFQVVEDAVDGTQMWRGLNDDGAGNAAVSRASAKYYSEGALAYGSDFNIGDKRDDLITGLEKYGSPQQLWIMTEASAYVMKNDVPEELPLREMESVRSEKNGRAHLVHGVYLYFSLLHSLERYFSNNLDDMGPSRDAGMPANRQGPIFEMEGYPGIFFAAIDGGTSNYSSIMVYNQSGWHELYRAPMKGMRIRNLKFQVVPGAHIDKLWFSQGTDVVWVGFPTDTFDPTKDANYRFTYESHVISSWHYAGLKDVVKLYKSMKVWSEGLTNSDAYTSVFADYQLDRASETTWTELNGTFNTAPLQEVDFASANNVSGRRLRYRLRFYNETVNTLTSATAPVIEAVIMEILGRISTKFEFSWSFRVRDANEDIIGRPDDYALAETLMTQLDTWANAPTALTMRSLYSPYDNKTVLIEPSSLQPIWVDPSAQTEGHIASIRVTEI